jgi:hypothetical protein
MIELPKNVDLVKFAQKAYELSSPQGFGFLHAVSGGLSEEDAKSCICDEDRYSVLNMDYMHGRACKMFVTKSDGKWLLPDRWYDHTDKQYKELLQTFGIELPIDAEHGCACNCVDCQRKR